MAQSRRNFLKTGAALGASAFVASRSRLAYADNAAAINPKLQQFGYGDVTLLEGPLREQFDRNHAFYRALDEDALLKPYRQRAGLPAPGEDMGGWYSWAPIGAIDQRPNNGFAPGHSFGQYVSGLSRYYAATGDITTQQKVHRLVTSFAAAITPHFWNDNRFPAYTYDKISIGMIDAHQFAATRGAFKALDAALDSVSKHLPPRGLSRAEQIARPHAHDESFCWDEPYTLPENAFLAWQRGAGSRYRDLAVRFLADDWYWNPLAANENVLPGKHAYSHVNAMSSAMQAYFVLGSEEHLQAARNGFDFVCQQSFATGGWGPNEEFRKPGSGDLGESLTKTHSSFETPCGSYAHFKITRYLLRATGDSRYGDSMERVLYNCILGAKPIAEDGHGFYYSDYNNDGVKVYHPCKWHCCTGTFAQVVADYGISAYFHDADGVYVNLFVPSRVEWVHGSARVQIAQSTGYPHAPQSEMRISTDFANAFPIYMRVPAWSGSKTRISVNGKPAITGPEPGKFARIDRTWNNNDRIEIEFDMPTVLEAVDAQHPNLNAVMHGPMALFAIGTMPASVRKGDLLAVRQLAPGSTNWQAKASSGSITLRPFPAIQDEHYRLYLPVAG
jgi:DUF1680 family protein